MKPLYNINEVIKLINLSETKEDLIKLMDIVIEDKCKYPLIEFNYIKETALERKLQLK